MITAGRPSVGESRSDQDKMISKSVRFCLKQVFIRLKKVFIQKCVNSL